MYRTARRIWEKSSGFDRKTSMLNAATGKHTRVSSSHNSSISSTGTGIRDLDISARTNTTTATEKIGYLYFPAPNFQQVFVTIKKGRITIERDGARDIHLDVKKQNIKYLITFHSRSTCCLNDRFYNIDALCSVSYLIEFFFFFFS
jgi:hypothetical protein